MHLDLLSIPESGGKNVKTFLEYRMIPKPGWISRSIAKAAAGKLSPAYVNVHAANATLVMFLSGKHLSLVNI